MLLKHLLENGQDLCQATIDDTDCDALVEREALKLTISAVKPVAHWPLRIAIFVHGGNVQDVYANVEGVAVTMVNHDNGEEDEDIAFENQLVVESMSTEFPFNCL
jgi:hypothetical protein